VARLWWVNPDALPASPEALALLNPEELAKYHRFIPALKRHEYLVTRVMVRTLLGEALGIAPEDVHFLQNEWGRPDLPPPAPLRFNVSHTPGLVVCLVSRSHEVGVDTELLSRAPRLLALAPKVFAARERAELSALPPGAQEARAVRLWTLKESYIKARGMGLLLPLQAFAFRFEADRVRLEVEPKLQDDGERWQFQSLTLGAHLVSTAIARPAADPVAVELTEFAAWPSSR
jgi:4'-phosphopantetheinyl transferase